MAAPKKQEYVLVLKTRDQAKKVIEALGKTGFNEARKMARGYKQVRTELTTMEKVGKRVTNALRGGFSKLTNFLRGNLLSTLALVLATFVSFQSIRASTNAASEFQFAIAEVATILPEAEEGVLDLRDSVLKLATAQGENEKIVAKGLYQTISAGVSDAGEALKVLETGSRLAVAGLASTDQTVDLLTTTLNAYRLEAAESARISDVFFETVRLGKTTIPELASSIGPVLPLASALGVEIEEVAAAIATLTQQGFSTSDASTAVKALFKSLITQGESVDKVFKRVGATYDLTTVRQIGLTETARLLAEGLNDPSEALEVLGARIEATNALLGITGQNFESFSATGEQLTKSLGATSRAYDKIADSDARKVKVAINAVRIAFLDLGDAVLKAVAGAVESLGGVDALQASFRQLGLRIEPIITNLIELVADFARGFIVTGNDIEIATKKAQLFGLQLDGVFDKVTRVARAIGLIPDEVSKATRVLQEVSLQSAGALELDSSDDAVFRALESLSLLGKRSLDNFDPFALRVEGLIEEIQKLDKSARSGGFFSASSLAPGELDKARGLIEELALLSDVELAKRREAESVEAEVTRQRVLQGEALRRQIADLERARGLEAGRISDAARSLDEQSQPSFRALTLPNFQNGVALPGPDLAGVEKAIADVMKERLRVAEALRLSQQQVTLDAKDELAFRELLASVSSQAAISSGEREQIERELVSIFEERTLAQATEIGVEGARLEALRAALVRVREARELDIEAARRGITLNFQSFEAAEKAFLSQVEGQEAALELVKRETTERTAAIELLREQGRLTESQAQRLLELIGLIDRQRAASAGGASPATGRGFESQAAQLLGQLDNSAAQIEAIRLSSEARRQDIELQVEQQKLNDAQAASLLSLVDAIEKQNVAQASVTPTMLRAQQAVDAYTQSLAFGLEDALVAVATGAKSTKDAMKDFVSSLISDLIRLAIRLTITNILLAIFDAYTTFGTGTTVAVKNAATLASLSQLAIAPGIAGVPVTDGFADGGVQAGGFGGLGSGAIVTKPILAPIGEGGSDEAVIPLKGGAVPVQMTGGGQGPVVNFNISAIDPRGGTEYILSKKREIVAMINEALIFDQPTKSNVRSVAGTRGGGL